MADADDIQTLKALFDRCVFMSARSDFDSVAPNVPPGDFTITISAKEMASLLRLLKSFDARLRAGGL